MAFSGPNVMSSGAAKAKEVRGSCAAERVYNASSVGHLQKLKEKNTKIFVNLLVYIAFIVTTSFCTLEKLDLARSPIYLNVLSSIARG